MLGKKLGIDLGTASLRILVKGEDVVLQEPTVVAPADPRSGRPAVFGAAALEADGGMAAVRPLRDGEIVAPEALDQLLELAVSRVVGRQRIFKPDMVITVMSTLPGDQRRQLLESAARAGARTVYLLDAPIAAAMGSRLRTASTAGHLVIDIGAGKTEVCALAEEGTIASRCLPGPPRLLSHAPETAAALHEVLEEVPQVLLADIRREGVILCGGGASLDGLDRHLMASAGISVRVAADAHLCAVRGAGLAVENLDMLRRNIMYIR